MTTNQNAFESVLAELITAEKSLDICFSFLREPENRELELVLDSCKEVIQKGAKVRCMTNITTENSRSYKDIAKSCEVRHIEGLTGFLGLADSRIFCSYQLDGGMSESEPNPPLTSASKALVQTQQYFFNAIWAKATPLTERVRQLEDGEEPEHTEIVTGWPGIFQKTMEGFENTERGVDHCCDSAIPPKMLGSPVTQSIEHLRARGGRTRMITEITSDNVAAIKLLMKDQEIRHIDGFSLNFGISDKMFSAPTSVYSVSTEPQCIWSNSKSLIKQHQYLFDTLWKKALPAEVRIKEIELGIAPDVIETMSDPDQVMQILQKVIVNVERELLLIIPSPGAFSLFEHAGLTKLILEGLGKRGVKTKLLTPLNEDITRKITQWKKTGQDTDDNTISLRDIEGSIQTMVSIIVADKSFALAIEMQDTPASSIKDAIGLATYSNSRATVLSYVSIFDSIWAQTGLYNDVRSLYEQQKIDEKRQKEFMDIAAHELRNPLEPILGLAKILRRHALDAQSRELIDIIIRNARRIQRLQAEILDVTKIEQQLLWLDKELTSLDYLIKSIVNDISLNKAANEGKVAIIYEPDETLLVKVDRTRLTQVITNLLDNALKFTKEGRITIKAVKRGDGNIQVSITDTGQGIDEDMLPSLFTKFVSKGSSTGTGLGLYISKGIVEAHSGKIWAENNKEGGGATFHFILPSAKEPDI